MTLHLLKSDWRRLWPLIVLGWIWMITKAVPAWEFDVQDLVLFDLEGALKSHSPFRPSAYTPPQWWQILLYPLKSEALGLYVLGMSAVLGFTGVSWDGTRPIRRIDFIRSKLLGLLGFIIGPQLLILSSILIVQGMGWSGIPALVIRAGTFLLLLHGLSLLFGRLCGGFWPWLAGALGLKILATLSIALREWKIPTLGIKTDIWAADPSAWWPVLTAIIAVALLSYFFNRRRPILRILLACLAITILPPLAEKVHPPIGRMALEALPDVSASIDVQLSDSSVFYGEWLSLETSGLDDHQSVVWMLERGHPLSSSSGQIAHYQYSDKLMPEGSLLPTKLNQGSFQRFLLPKSAEIQDPTDFTNGDHGDLVYLGSFDKDQLNTSSADFSLDAQLFGIVGHNKLVTELPLGGKKTLTINGTEVHLHFKKEPVPHVDIRSMRSPGSIGVEPFDPIENLRMLVHLPAEEGTVEWRRHGGNQPILGEVSADAIQFLPQEYFQYSGYDDNNMVREPLPDIIGAKAMVFLPKVLGKIRKRLRADGMTSQRRYQHQPSPEIWTVPPEACRQGVNCGMTMPGPDTCTREEAALWIDHVLSHHENGDWPNAALSPFVDRFPDLFFRSDDSGWSPISNILSEACSEENKDAILQAYSNESDPRRTSHLLSVIAARGWIDDAKSQILENFRNTHDYNDTLFRAVCYFEDPSTFPRLVEQLRGLQSLEAYWAVRQLDGIKPLIDAVLQDEGRKLALQSAKEDHQKRPLSYALMIPASHGVPEAFERFWSLAADDSLGAPMRINWYPLSQILISPHDFKRDEETWRQFLKAHQANDFEYDALACKWRLKPSNP